MKKILVVEDDVFFAGRLRELLVDHGHSVFIASSTEEALKLSADYFDWAIIDVMLPNDESITKISAMESRGGYLSGIPLARRLKSEKRCGAIILLSGTSFDTEASTWAEREQIPFLQKNIGPKATEHALISVGLIDGDFRPSSFIVHGHDDQSLYELKDFIQNTLGWRKPVVLREEQNCGRTIIEKFEWFSTSVDWVFVLFTPDDRTIGRTASDDENEKRRARQNVIFEMGYFYGKIDRLRGRIVALVKGQLELPSDISGIVWISIDNGVKSAGEEIRREIGQIRPDLLK